MPLIQPVGIDLYNAVQATRKPGLNLFSVPAAPFIQLALSFPLQDGDAYSLLKDVQQDLRTSQGHFTVWIILVGCFLR
jgi:hypothetical protein